MPVPVLLFLAGCTYSEDRFYEDYQAAYCDWAVRCGYFATADECTALAAPPAEGCEYDPKAARACVDGLSSMACPADDGFPEFPDACASVHTSCDTGTTGDTAS